MNATGSFQLSQEPGISDWNTRFIVLAIVIAFHGLAFLLWSQGGRHEAFRPGMMEISFEMAQSQKPVAVAPAPRLEKTVQPRKPTMPEPVVPAQVQETTQSEPVTTTAPAAAPVTPAPLAPVVAVITEPEYKASYLNNTPPTYPLAARRMGMQGRVLLHVEVLAAGMSGKIEVSKSSGYAMLDTAAMNAVKSWRFVPATQAGQAVDKWFIIPIQFSLKEA